LKRLLHIQGSAKALLLPHILQTCGSGVAAAWPEVNEALPARRVNAASISA
jgi:hypothetical protein